MDKILFGAYLSVLAAFITAAVSIVKLVNEKESKTTDYRQSWTDSVRSALSQLIGSISLQSSYLHNRTDLLNNLIKTHSTNAEPDQAATKEAVLAYLTESLKELNTLILENRQNIQKYYALTSLHFKPNDEVFLKIEHKYEQVEDLLQKLVDAKEPEKEGDRREYKEKVSTAVTELTNTSRYILKTEWEHVKSGESAYRRTKAWSQYIGIATFAILVFCGIYMLAYNQAQNNIPAIISQINPSDGVKQQKAQQPQMQQFFNMENGACSSVKNQSSKSKQIPLRNCDQSGPPARKE